MRNQAKVAIKDGRPVAVNIFYRLIKEYPTRHLGDTCFYDGRSYRWD